MGGNDLSVSRKLLSTTVWAVLLSSLLASAGAQEAPSFATENTWFQCGGSTIAWNANLIVDETAPT